MVFHMNDLMRRVQEGINNQSYGTMLGLTVEEAEEGRVVISCKKRADLLQQTGILHGGVIGSLCESAAGYAAITVLPEGGSVIGVEYKVNFLRAITTDKAIAVGKVIKRGKQLIVVDVEAFNDGDDRVAAKLIFTGTPIQG